MAYGRLFLQRGHLADDHITPIAALTLKKPPGGRTIAKWRHHFQELAAECHQGILQSEARHVRVPMADRCLKDSFDIPQAGVQFFGDQADLAEVDRHGAVLILSRLVFVQYFPVFINNERYTLINITIRNASSQTFRGRRGFSSIGRYRLLVGYQFTLRNGNGAVVGDVFAMLIMMHRDSVERRVGP